MTSLIKGDSLAVRLPGSEKSRRLFTERLAFPDGPLHRCQMNDVDPIAELQERLTYQDDALEKLDQALLDQHRRLERLEASLERAQRRLEALEAPASGEEPPEPPPPHY